MPAKRKTASDSSTAAIGFEADLVDCMVALPGQLFYSKQIPVFLWFIWKKDAVGKCRSMSELEHALAA